MNRRKFFRAVTGLGSAAVLAPTALVAKDLTPNEIEAFRRAWQDGYMSLNEIRAIRQYEAGEICRLFNVPPLLVLPSDYFDRFGNTDAAP